MPRGSALKGRGAGQAFCSGQDLREHADVLASGAEPTATVRQHYNPIITTIMTMPKPVIAAVSGNAAGAGASLALACDFRVAARLAEGPTAAYAGIKAQLQYSATHGLAESLEHEAQVQHELGQTADHRAATLAFTRKERPVFHGS